MAIALILVLVVALALVVADMYRRSRSALILQVSGGLRFEAHRFSVQVQRAQQELHVQCRRGVLKPQASPAPGGPLQVGPVACNFAAVGISVEVRDCVRPEKGAAGPRPTGYFDVVMRGADGTQLTIERVNAPVATSFKHFYLQVRHWIDKLEQRIARERTERVRIEEGAAQAQQHDALMAQLLAGRTGKEALTPAECEVLAAAQIASWRQAAGFEGLHSAHHTDANGHVVWFVDVAADGRITLHAHKHTLHSTLRGARVESRSGALEVGVRDAHWTEEGPELRDFLVLKGRTAEERRVWKERLEALCNNLN
jgi:hypothetical protein